MKKIIALFSFLLIAFAQSFAQNSETPADMFKYMPKLKIGDKAPNFTLPVYNGKKKVSLSDYRGKYVLVDFWASWCGDCRREMPIMEDALKDYAGKIEVLSISFDKKKDALVGYLKQHPVSYKVACDYSAWKESAVAKAFQLAWIPTFYIVAPDGTIVGSGISGEGLKHELQSIFNSDSRIKEKIVYRDENIEFHQIDEHTWHGNGTLCYNESVYLIEGEKSAILIDAGVKMPGLRKIAESIVKKPVELVISHAHGDHIGASSEWDVAWINAADEAIIPENYQNTTKRKYMTDGMIFDLGGREIEVVFTPGHTPGSTTFIDRKNHYGFSSDAFGSGNLLVFTNLSTQSATCQRMKRFIEKYGIKYFYPGHYWGDNLETPQRVSDVGELCEEVLDGKKEGATGNSNGFKYVLDERGVKLNYNEAGKR